MQDQLQEFRTVGVDIVVVSFVQPTRLTQYLKVRPWPFRFLADPDRSAYRAFGLESASWWRLLHPRVIGRYLGLILRGRRPQMAHEDVHQLGGDFVLDRTGRVVYEFRSRDPADRPSIEELLAAVRRAAETQSHQ